MSNSEKIRVGIVGASGFTGAELMRLLGNHPEMELVAAAGDTQAGIAIKSLYPSLAASYGDMLYSAYDPDDFQGLDIVFLGLPHMASQPIAADLYNKVGCLLDLGSDFRLKDPALYPEWYGAEHSMPDLLDDFVYGLPEIFRNELKDAKAVAVPGLSLIHI